MTKNKPVQKIIYHSFSKISLFKSVLFIRASLLYLDRVRFVQLDVDHLFQAEGGLDKAHPTNRKWVSSAQL